MEDCKIVLQLFETALNCFCMICITFGAEIESVLGKCERTSHSKIFASYQGSV